MNCNSELNKVILIGGNNHSGLGAVRSLGVNGIRPYGIIVSENRNENNFVQKSKYWEKTWQVRTDEEAIRVIMLEFGEEELPPVLIPWSDSAAKIIDCNLDKLKRNFIVPSIGNRQGEITRLMNKHLQVDFARKYNIPIAKTWILDLNNFEILQDFVFPCIMKPVISCEGNKIDIVKCENEKELCENVVQLRKKGYSKILLQEFIFFDYEYVVSGCCGKEKAYYISKNIRSWPIIGGTGSFSQCTDSDKVHDFAIKLIESMQMEGYTGLFDIEVFEKDGRMFLNEINWRIGGKDYLCMGTNVHYAVIWYYSMIGKNTSSIQHICKDTKQFCMDETTDLRHVVYGDMTFKAWMTERKKTTCFAIWLRRDLAPVISRYFSLFREIVKRIIKG